MPTDRRSQPLWLGLMVLAGLMGCQRREPLASVDDRPAAALRKLPVAERVTAAERLGTPGPGASQAIPVLVDLLDGQDDRDLLVQAAAVAALVRIGPPSVPALLAALDRPGDEAADRLITFGARQALAKLGPEVVPGLLERLGDPTASEALRLGVVQAIEDRQPPEASAVPVLVRILEQEPDVTRLRGLVARCLGALGPAAGPAIPTLVRLMAEAPDPRNETQFAFDAMTALGRIGPGAAPALTELAGQSRGAARFRAARALAETGPEGAHAAIPFLIQVAEDPDLRDDDGWITLIDALSELGRHRDRPELAVPALVRRLDDEEPEVRGWAAATLREYGPAAEPGIPRLVELLGDAEGHPESSNAMNAMNTLAAIGPKAVPALVAGLKAPDATARSLAAGALGAVKPRPEPVPADAVAALIAATRDPESGVRESAATALGDWQVAAAVPRLIELLDDPAPEPAQAAVHALGTVGLPAAAPARPRLLAAATDPAHPQHFTAFYVLARFDPEARAVVMSALKSPDPEARTAAAAALGQAGPAASDALPALRAVADDPVPEVRGAVGRALRLITETDAPDPR